MMSVMSTSLDSVLVNWKVLFLLLLVVFIIRSIADTLCSRYRLRHIKEPPSASFSKWWMIRHVSGGTMHLDLAEGCEKYGLSTPSSWCAIF